MEGSIFCCSVGNIQYTVSLKILIYNHEKIVAKNHDVDVAVNNGLKKT